VGIDSIKAADPYKNLRQLSQSYKNTNTNNNNIDNINLEMVIGITYFYRCALWRLQGVSTEGTNGGGEERPKWRRVSKRPT